MQKNTTPSGLISTRKHGDFFFFRPGEQRGQVV
jgi:hypothetical protein